MLVESVENALSRVRHLCCHLSNKENISLLVDDEAFIKSSFHSFIFHFTILYTGHVSNFKIFDFQTALFTKRRI